MQIYHADPNATSANEVVHDTETEETKAARKEQERQADVNEAHYRMNRHISMVYNLFGFLQITTKNNIGFLEDVHEHWHNIHYLTEPEHLAIIPEEEVVFYTSRTPLDDKTITVSEWFGLCKLHMYTLMRLCQTYMQASHYALLALYAFGVYCGISCIFCVINTCTRLFSFINHHRGWLLFSIAFVLCTGLFGITYGTWRHTGHRAKGASLFCMTGLFQSMFTSWQREEIQRDYTSHDIDYVSCGKIVKYRPANKKRITKIRNEITFNDYNDFRSYEKTLPMGNYLKNGIDVGSNLFGFVPTTPEACPVEEWKLPEKDGDGSKATIKNMWDAFKEDFSTTGTPPLEIPQDRVANEVKKFIGSMTQQLNPIQSNWFSQKVSEIVWESIGELMYPLMHML